MKRLALLLTLALTGPALPAAAETQDPPAAVEAAKPTVEALLQAALAEAAEERQARAVLQERLHRMELDNQGSGDSPAVAILVPTGFFLTVVALLAMVLAFRSRVERIRHETIQKVLDRGGELPEDLLAPAARPSDLRRGLVLVTGGVGLMAVFLLIKPDQNLWGMGLFPVMVGVGYLLYWWLEQRGTDVATQ
ncbi:MAG: hypothetical protein KC933_08210 [Myxococcales bacterium]|nr:hypothetical protein [Myxococcales bacterium]